MKLESTQDILNKLMSNTSLNPQQQRELNSRLHSKQMTKQEARQMYSSGSVHRRDYNYNPSMFGNRSSYFTRKKTLDQMLSENPELYEVEKAKVSKTVVNRDKMKEDLALAMEFRGKDQIPKRLRDARNGKIRGKAPVLPKENMEPPKSADDLRFEECMQEVEERMQWLNEMRRIGEGAKYEAMIKGQCALLIKEMREIDKRKEESEKRQQ